MIVCLCNRVSDRDITAAVHQGTRCFEQLQDQTGVAACCGCCHDCAREVFDSACSSSATAASAMLHPAPALHAA